MPSVRVSRVVLIPGPTCPPAPQLLGVQRDPVGQPAGVVPACLVDPDDVRRPRPELLQVCPDARGSAEDDGSHGVGW